MLRLAETTLRRGATRRHVDDRDSAILDTVVAQHLLQLLLELGIERIEAYLRLLLFHHLDLLRRSRRLREPPEDVDVLNAERNPKNPKQ